MGEGAETKLQRYKTQQRLENQDNLPWNTSGLPELKSPRISFIQNNQIFECYVLRMFWVLKKSEWVALNHDAQEV